MTGAVSAATSRYLSARTAVEALVTAGIAGALSLIVFGPILSRLSAPLGGGDMLATYVDADNGLGLTASTHYGFPAGMDLAYTPNLDLTERAFARVVDVVGGSSFLGLNLLLLLSFPLVAALAYLLLRMVSRGGPVAVALAVSFTMIPYHFGRGLGHTYLATMYGGVTAVMLAALIGLGLLPAAVRGGGRARRVLGWVLLAGLVVVTAWSGLYYAAFAVILGLAAVVWRIARGDAWRRVALSLGPVAAVLALAVVGFLPALIAAHTSPPTAPIAQRTAADSITYAGSLAMAVVPAPISQVPGMWRYNGAVNEALGQVVGSSPPVESTSLTNFGTWITSASLLVFLVGWVVRARRRTLGGTAVTFVGYLTAVTVLFFVPWGLNYLVAELMTAQVRAWNRLLPILLLLFVTGAMAVLRRTRADRTSAWTLVAGAALLAVVAIDQVIPFRPAYAQGATAGTASVDAARAYAQQLNAAIPAHCGVLQLPYAQYPEQGVIPPSLGDYEHFLQPLVNDGKDFSYGAVKGTSASEFLASLGPSPRGADLDALRQRGFCAIHLDHRGMTDQAWTFLNLDLTAALGAPVATGDGGVWQAYSLTRQ